MKRDEKVRMKLMPRFDLKSKVFGGLWQYSASCTCVNVSGVVKNTEGYNAVDRDYNTIAMEDIRSFLQIPEGIRRVPSYIYYYMPGKNI